jgi:hypothetical protein
MVKSDPAAILDIDRELGERSGGGSTDPAMPELS